MLPPTLSICGDQVQPWEWKGSRRAPQQSCWWAAGGLLEGEECYGLVYICRFVYVFFPAGFEVSIYKQLGMCERQCLPRSHLCKSWPALGPVQTETVVVPNLGKWLFRPRKTIFKLFKFDCKTQQQLRWHNECLLSVLALGIPTDTVTPSF